MACNIDSDLEEYTTGEFQGCIQPYSFEPRKKCNSNSVKSSESSSEDLDSENDTQVQR